MWIVPDSDLLRDWEIEVKRRAIIGAFEAFGDDDAQDDGAVLSSVGPPLASVTPSRFALASLPPF